MTKRNPEELEKLEGIGDIEVPEDGFEVEDTHEDEFNSFTPDEIIEEIETDDLDEVDSEYLQEPKQEVEEEEK